MTGIPAMQDMRWSSFPVDSHHFPKLRLKFKQNLISLAGGMTRLPVTDPKVRTAHALQSCKAFSVVKTKKTVGHLAHLMSLFKESLHVWILEQIWILQSCATL